MQVDTDRARSKARAKAEITRILRSFSLDEQADILADLTIMIEDAEPKQRPADETSGSAAKRSAGRPRGASTSGKDTRTQVLLNLLQPGNRLSIADMANHVYGSSEDKVQTRLRSLLASLKKRKLVRSPSRGRWEATKQKK